MFLIKGNWINIAMDCVSVVVGILLVMLVICWGRCQLPFVGKVGRADAMEGFASNRNQDEFFGNLVAYKTSANGIPSGTVISLPGRVRITGLYTTTFISDASHDIRVYIADNASDARSADTRVEIVDTRQMRNSKSGATLQSDVVYNDYLNMFQPTSSGKNKEYTGSAILVEVISNGNSGDNSDASDNTNNSVIPVLESVYIYGMPANALDKTDYDKMPMVTATSNLKTADTYRVTLTSGDFKVGYIHMPGLRVHTAFTIQVQYSNSLDGNSAKYNLEGPNRLHWSDGQPFIYLAEPVIAQNIYITVPNADIRGSIMPSLEQGVNIYGFPATKRDTINFKLRSGTGLGGGMGSARDNVGLVISGRKCPNIRDIMHKQLQAQQICEALEYKDKAKNNKIAYEKEKSFLAKLQQQDTEIQNLETIIEQLMARKQSRLEAAEGHNMEEVDREFRHLSELKKDVEDHLTRSKAPTTGLNLDVNLQPK